MLSKIHLLGDNLELDGRKARWEKIKKGVRFQYLVWQ